MGNQIVCPSGQSWYLEDLNDIGLKIENSILDGTFMLSFQAANSNGRQRVVKALKLTDKSQDKMINSFKDMFMEMGKASETLSGNYISHPIKTKSGAYLIRDYLDLSLSDRIASSPAIEPIEKRWYAFQLLKAVQNLFKAGFRHGDIKPENVFISRNGFIKLTDHAPFKPNVISRNQPHYFIHFFSYGRGCCFTAPERIVDPSVNHSTYAPYLADLFSIGCVIAYIYTNGKPLFNFTTIMQYADGDDTCLELLNEIEDEDVRGIVKTCLDRNPQGRVKVLQNLGDHFPRWFMALYDMNLLDYLDDRVTELITTTPEKLLEVFKDCKGEELLLLLTILDNALTSKNSVSGMLRLLEIYKGVIMQLNNVHVKITRVLTRLLAIFDFKSTIVSIRAFEIVLEFLETIDTLPEEYSDVGEAYVVPTLAKSLSMNDNWCQWCISKLPTIIRDLGRLWPSVTSVIPSTPDFFMQMVQVLGKNNVDPQKLKLVKSFLADGIAVALSAPYSVIRSIVFIVFQLMNADCYIPMIAEFITNVYNKLSPEGVILFDDEFADSLQRGLLNIANEDNDSITHILMAFDNMLEKGALNRALYSLLANLLIKCVRSKNTAVRSTAKMVIKKLPRIYQIMIKAGQLAPSVDKSEEPSTPDVDTENIRRAPRTCHFGSFICRSSKSKPEDTKLVMSCKCFQGSVCHLVKRNNDIIATNKQRELVKINTWVDSAPRMRQIFSVQFSSEITNVDVASKHVVVTCTDAIDTLDLSSFEKKSRFMTRVSVKGSTMLSDDVISYFSNSKTNPIITIANVTTGDVRATYKFSDVEVLQLARFRDASMMTALTSKNSVMLFDARVSLPVLVHNVHGSKIDRIHALSDFKYVLQSQDGYEFYDMMNIWMPFFKVSQRTDCAMTNRGTTNNSVFSRNIMLCDQGGTFMVNPQGTSYSLFDNSPPIEMKPVANVLELPRHVPMSLHGHTFPVTAGYWTGGECVTGDSAGYINLWLPKKRKAPAKT